MGNPYLNILDWESLLFDHQSDHHVACLVTMQQWVGPLSCGNAGFKLGISKVRDSEIKVQNSVKSGQCASRRF